MKVNFLKYIEVNPCKSVYRLKLKDINLLPQKQELNDFISLHNISDLGATEHHDLITIIVSDNKYISLSELESTIISASKFSKKYLYLAVNKFMIYSESDTLSVESTSTDYDLYLIEYCYNLIKNNFKMIKSTHFSNDKGNLGNFVHPVTTMFFRRHD